MNKKVLLAALLAVATVFGVSAKNLSEGSLVFLEETGVGTVTDEIVFTKTASPLIASKEASTPPKPPTPKKRLTPQKPPMPKRAPVPPPPAPKETPIPPDEEAPAPPKDAPKPPKPPTPRLPKKSSQSSSNAGLTGIDFGYIA